MSVTIEFFATPRKRYYKGYVCFCLFVCFASENSLANICGNNTKISNF